MMNLKAITHKNIVSEDFVSKHMVLVLLTGPIIASGLLVSSIFAVSLLVTGPIYFLSQFFG